MGGTSRFASFHKLALSLSALPLTLQLCFVTDLFAFLKTRTLPAQSVQCHTYRLPSSSAHRKTNYFSLDSTFFFPYLSRSALPLFNWTSNLLYLFPNSSVSFSSSLTLFFFTFWISFTQISMCRGQIKHMGERMVLQHKMLYLMSAKLCMIPEQTSSPPGSVALEESCWRDASTCRSMQGIFHFLTRQWSHTKRWPTDLNPVQTWKLHSPCTAWQNFSCLWTLYLTVMLYRWSSIKIDRSLVVLVEGICGASGKMVSM